MKRPHRPFFALAAAMLVAASLHDAWDAWVDRTVLPGTLSETSVEMRDRDGKLMRAFEMKLFSIQAAGCG